MSRLRGWVRNAFMAAAIGVGGIIVGFAVRERAPDSSRAADAPPRQTDETELASAERVTGTLSSGSLAQLTRGRHANDVLVIVLIAEKDCLTCEDLGRQIRSLVASVPDPRAVLLASPVTDSARVERFVRIERLGLHVTYLETSIALADGSVVPTPAALVIDRAGTVLRGVAHLASVKNVRTVSFAEELGYVPQGVLPLLKTHQKEDVK